MERLSRFWLRPSIGRRIALAMVISLILVQAQAFFQIYHSNPVILITGTRWLAETAAEAARETFHLPWERRQAWLSGRAEHSMLRLTWTISKPWSASQGGQDSLTMRFDETLKQMLGHEVRAVEVQLIKLNARLPFDSIGIKVAPAIVGDALGSSPVRSDEPDIPMPMSVRIAIQGEDGSWLGIEPFSFEEGDGLFQPPFTLLLGGGLIIILASTYVARRIMSPLGVLVRTAERIGSAREFMQVPQSGLGEFVVVARAFEDMQRRLLRFVEDRTQMLAAISHDLRTSLTRLRLSTEDYHGQFDKTAMVREIEYMQTMLEMTLSFASGEARTRPTQKMDVAALLMSLADEAADAGYDSVYVGPDHAEAIAHPVSLRRAFSNLIDNALKYGGEVRVELEILGKNLIIRVEDRGPGIASGQREKALQPFQRLVPARGGDIPGAGLGLTIARDVIQSHGGSLDLLDRPGGGLTVLTKIPLNQPS